MIKKFAILGVLATMSFISGCDEEGDPFVIPTQYEGDSFTANASAELAVLNQLKAVRDEAFKGRTNGQTVSAAVLNAAFNSGSPTLKSMITSYYAAKLEGDNGHFAQIALASGNTYTLGDIESDGGTFGGYLFEENGIELEQLIEKGMFGAVLYNHAVNLMAGNLDNTTSDKVLAIFGANPTFPSSSDGTKHPSPDKYAAVYAARRDKNDGNGFYSNIKNNLIKLQAAIKGGSDYKKEQTEAIVAIEENWEKSNAATVIFYLNEVISKLSETNPTDPTIGAALHSLAECIGFIEGLSSIDDDHKIITENEIKEILDLFLAPADGVDSTYLFATNPQASLPKLSQVINKLKTIYGFTDVQMEEFKINWVAQQGR